MSPDSFSLPRKARMQTKTPAFALLAFLTIVLAACGQDGGTANITHKSSGILNVVPGPKGDFTNGFSPFSSTANYGAQGMIYETLLFFNRMDGTSRPWLEPVLPL